MSTALWLILAGPKWYFSTITALFAADLFTALPAAGIVSFVAGIIMGIYSRAPRLALFALPFLITEFLLVISGLLRGHAGGGAGYVIFGFLALQFVCIAYLIHHLKEARVAAALLAIFSGTYALFGAFVAVMSFADDWL